ncbi:EamA family transporter [bacterium]|nr:EamA family transporter [bacterium]
MNAKQSALIKLHSAVVIFGFTAILGKLITLDEGPLVWYRMLIASLGLLFLPRFWRAIRQVKPRDAVKVALTGGVVALHWVTFFGSIKYSNVSFALCMMSTASLFTSVLEPLILRRPISVKEILLGLMIIPGIYIVFQFSQFYLEGMVLGLSSAFLAALFGSINKTFVVKMRPVAVTFIELSSGFIILSAFLPLYFYMKPDAGLAITNPMDLLWLLLLGIVCTTLAFILAVDVLKELSAFTSALAVNLEPIYGIILAAIIFNEHEEMNRNFYLGAGLIVSAIVLNGILKNRK